jgi:hypothetical protein
MSNNIKDYAVIGGTGGFTNVNDGTIHDVAEMLRLGFTVEELPEVPLTSRLVRPLLQQSRARDEGPKEFRPGWGLKRPVFAPFSLALTPTSLSSARNCAELCTGSAATNCRRAATIAACDISVRHRDRRQLVERFQSSEGDHERQYRREPCYLNL